MRYEARWSNGFWKLFDTQKYASADTFATQEQAIEAAADANKSGKWRQASFAEWALF